jgi:hypothetical protein
MRFGVIEYMGLWPFLVTPEGFAGEAEVALEFVVVDAGDGQPIEGARDLPRSNPCRGEGNQISREAAKAQKTNARKHQSYFNSSRSNA